MDYQDIVVICKNCETKVPMTKTRFDKSKTNLICLDCYKNLYGLNDEKIIQTADPNRINYSCSSCNYRFSRDKDFTFSVCPYCSKPTIKSEGLAILKNSNKKLSDY